MTPMMATGFGIGLALIVILTIALWSRPADLCAIFFVIGVAGLAVVVSWNWLDRYRMQQAAAVAFDRRITAENPVTPAAPDQARGGS